MALPSPDELRDATCVACPGQSLPLGAFDVAARPGPAIPYSPEHGHRVAAGTGAPTCVHPYRVGVPPAPYASAGAPLPAADTPAPPVRPADLELPADPTLLEAWLIAVLRAAPPALLARTLHRAEAAALERFHPADVTAALRRALHG
ncbi:hypothetical protein Dvina_35310 [Dactylosporangium vinaceum]|uniref:Uncharacterized protein n=1 Tax=Dactylosporangium vinaceum TaxID=53362 RepID=A0ABV5M4E3_9ACTN|nr:hypothetical protein [Dactylosporangium vinaceum]UAB93494.1 hypothetical protein Dvina_35310 [Dactylosporangium vinaceum]